MIELSLKNPFFLGDSPKGKQQDLCLHGEVTLKVNDVLLSDLSDWCVSASALRFLRSLFANHYQGNQEHIIPHCGHFMLFNEKSYNVEFGSCGLGIDFDVIHKDGNILIQTADNSEFLISFEEYKQAVLNFADQVEAFYRQNPERKITDDTDKEFYDAFWNEWYELKEKAQALTKYIYKAPEIIFDDYNSISDKDIFLVTVHGIGLKNGSFISFKDCAINYRNTHGGEGDCVGEADVSGSVKSLIFYTAPITTHMHFVSKGKIREILSIKNSKQRFMDLQKKIEKYGYRFSREA